MGDAALLRRIRGMLGQGPTGLVPVAPSASPTTKFLRGDGTWAVPSGSGGGITDHAGLSNLWWTASGHTATPRTLPWFSGTGAAATLAVGSTDRHVLGMSGLTPTWTALATIATTGLYQDAVGRPTSWSGAGLTGTASGLAGFDGTTSPTTYLLDTDGTLAANSNARVSTQSATKAYADTKIPASTLTTADDILIRDGSGPARLAAGGRGKAPMIDPLSGSLAYVPVFTLPCRVVIPESTTLRAVGGAATILGTGQGDTSDTVAQWLQFGGSTSGQNYGLTMLLGKGITPFCLDVVIRTGSNTGGRMWFGVSAGAPGNSDTPANNSAWVCFRNGTDTQWTAITRDGTTTSAAQNIAAIATTTAYRVRVRYDGTSYYMKVNNSGEVTCSGNLPSTSSSLSLYALVTADGSARNFEFCWAAFRPAQPAI